MHHSLLLNFLSKFCLGLLLATPIACSPSPAPPAETIVEAPEPPPPSDTAERYREFLQATDSDVGELVAQGKDYKILSLFYADNMTLKGFQALQKIPSLRSLHLSYSGRKMTLEECQAICKIPHLQELHLRNLGLSTEIIPQLAHLKYLTTLWMREPKFNLNDLKALFEAVPQLREIDFQDTPVTAEMCHYLAQTNLTKIAMSARAKNIDEGVRSLLTLKTLKDFMISSDHMTDEALANLSESSNLESLEIHGTRITDQGILQLEKLKKLKSLQLMVYGNLTDTSLISVGKIKTLQNLALGYNVITDEGLPHLSEMPKLAQLNIRCLERNLETLTGAGFAKLHSRNRSRVVNWSFQNVGKLRSFAI